MTSASDHFSLPPLRIPSCSLKKTTDLLASSDGPSAHFAIDPANFFPPPPFPKLLERVLSGQSGTLTRLEWLKLLSDKAGWEAQKESLEYNRITKFFDIAHDSANCKSILVHCLGKAVLTHYERLPEWLLRLAVAGVGKPGLRPVKALLNGDWADLSLMAFERGLTTLKLYQSFRWPVSLSVELNLARSDGKLAGQDQVKEPWMEMGYCEYGDPARVKLIASFASILSSSESNKNRAISSSLANVLAQDFSPHEGRLWELLPLPEQQVVQELFGFRRYEAIQEFVSMFLKNTSLLEYQGNHIKQRTRIWVSYSGSLRQFRIFISQSLFNRVQESLQGMQTSCFNNVKLAEVASLALDLVDVIVLIDITNADEDRNLRIYPATTATRAALFETTFNDQLSMRNIDQPILVPLCYLWQSHLNFLLMDRFNVKAANKQRGNFFPSRKIGSNEPFGAYGQWIIRFNELVYSRQREFDPANPDWRELAKLTFFNNDYFTGAADIVTCSQSKPWLVTHSEVYVVFKINQSWQLGQVTAATNDAFNVDFLNRDDLRKLKEQRKSKTKQKTITLRSKVVNESECVIVAISKR